MSLGRRLIPVFSFLAVVLVLANSTISSQSPSTKGVITRDDDFQARVKEWTTRPDFISPLVDHLPKVAGLPSPKDVLGHHVGAPKKLTYYADILRYYRALAAASPRVKIVSIGKSNENRDLVVVFVGSDQSIKDLTQYRTYLAQLADPRTITAEQAADIIAKAKPIYHLSGGLHSAEVGPSEMLMELAYRLVAEDSPIINAIRENVIVSITPVADPDGRDRNVDWYYKYGISETEGQTTGAGVPYWGKYVFHDDNRDINYSQVEMRSLLDWYLEWHPPIMHDLHQAQTLLYTFSGQAPQNPNLDPILYGELPMMANFEMAQFAKYGMPGVWTHGFVDMWSPGYLAFMSSNHNGMIRMYEIQGGSGANTQKLRLGNPNAGGGRGLGAAPDAAANAAGRGNQSVREWYRPWPATGEFDWSLRDNTNYGETGVITALQYTSQFPKIILENFYVKSRNSIETGRKETVAGYVIPAGQRDMTRIERLVNLLRLQGIELGRATSEVKLQEGTFPAGSFIVKRDQPYSRLAKILLEKQVYPDPSLRTYDDAAWTMGLMSQADVKEIADKKILDVPVTPVSEKEIHLAGSVRGSGPLFAVADYGSNNMITLRMHLKDLKVQAVEQEFKQGDATFPAGSFIVSGDPGRAPGRLARRRPASDRHVQHVGEHTGRRVGALRIRQIRRAVRPHLQRTCQERGSESRLRRHHRADTRRHRKAARVRHRESRSADRVQEIRHVQVPRRLRRVGRHHRRHGHRGRRPVREVRQSRRRPRDARHGKLLSRRVRPGAARRCRPRVGPILRARTYRRGRDPEAGSPDFLRLRQEDRSRALCERAAPHRPNRHQSVRGGAGRTAAAPAVHPDAVPRWRRSRAERIDAGGC